MKHYKGIRGKPSRKIWEILRQKAIKRDSSKCQICNKRENLQVDHCFSSSQCVRLRYDLRNLITLCAECHASKTYCVKGYEKMVDDIVKKREGKKTWDWMKCEAFKSETWKITELEEIQKRLENEKH